LFKKPGGESYRPHAFQSTATADPASTFGHLFGKNLFLQFQYFAIHIINFNFKKAVKFSVRPLTARCARDAEWGTLRKQDLCTHFHKFYLTILLFSSKKRVAQAINIHQEFNLTTQIPQKQSSNTRTPRW
jgi:hypothetical protein